MSKGFLLSSLLAPGLLVPILLVWTGCNAQSVTPRVTQSASEESAGNEAHSSDELSKSEMEQLKREDEALETLDIQAIETQVQQGPVDGELRAQLDIAAGKLILREQPLPNPPWWGRYTQLLRDRCTVEIDVIQHETARFSDADLEYNEVMKAEIERQHGKGILGRLEAEAMNK